MLDLQISADGVALLALDRPDVLNALNGALIDALLGDDRPRRLIEAAYTSL